MWDKMDCKTSVDYCGNVSVSVIGEIKVNLTDNDIFNWLNSCQNAETLKYLGKAALSFARAIENTNFDDFRSRA